MVSSCLCLPYRHNFRINWWIFMKLCIDISMPTILFTCSFIDRIQCVPERSGVSSTEKNNA